MKVAYYYFPGCDPDEIEKPFESIRPALNWGKWYCEQNGTDEFSVLYGRKFFTYHVFEGEWCRNGKSNQSKTPLKSPSVPIEPTNKRSKKR